MRGWSWYGIFLYITIARKGTLCSCPPPSLSEIAFVDTKLVFSRPLKKSPIFKTVRHITQINISFMFVIGP